MQSESVEIVFGEDVQDFLIDRGLKLTTTQRQVIASLIDALRADPEIGEHVEPAVAQWFPAKRWIEEHLGDGLHIAFYYNIEQNRGIITVRIVAVRFGIKM